MKVFLFHLMPYAYLDLDYDKKYRSAWVVLPNSYFDPKKGHELYNRYLDELEYGEELGFDGLCVNEHHQNAYGIMPSPIVTASALARRTERVKLAIVGSAFGIREHPLTLAEEHAMIDCISGGRLISGMVRGIGCEYYSMGANPAFSHDRFHEAHDLVIRAWTEEGTVRLRGRALPLRIRQSVAPPLPGSAPADLVPVAGLDRDHRVDRAPRPQIHLSPDLQPVPRGEEVHGRLPRQGAGIRLRGEARPARLAGADLRRRHRRAGARRGPAPYRGVRQQVPAQSAGDAAAPPGYTSIASLKNVRKHKSSLSKSQTVESLIEDEVVVIGSPDTVREKLLDCQRRVALGNVLALCQFGTLPADLTRKNMEMFSAEVMPALQSSHIEQPELVAAE